MTPFVCSSDHVAELADLRAQLTALQAVALELIAERDRAVAELERVAQLTLADAEDRSVKGRTL